MSPGEKNKEKPKPSSMTEVHSVQQVFSGVRTPVGFRCDTGLWKRFKQVAKATSGSICRAIEPMLVAYLGLAEKEVHFGKTVVIDHLHIERNLRSRRALEVREETEERPVFCEYPDCHKIVMYRVILKGTSEVAYYCRDHFNRAKGRIAGSRKLKGPRELLLEGRSWENE